MIVLEKIRTKHDDLGVRWNKSLVTLVTVGTKLDDVYEDWNTAQ